MGDPVAIRFGKLDKRLFDLAARLDDGEYLENRFTAQRRLDRVHAGNFDKDMDGTAIIWRNNDSCCCREMIIACRQRTKRPRGTDADGVRLSTMVGKDLADSCGVSSATIKRMEEVDHMPNSLSDNLVRVRDALSNACVEFIPEDGGGAGVRLKKA